MIGLFDFGVTGYLKKSVRRKINSCLIVKNSIKITDFFLM